MYTKIRRFEWDDSKARRNLEKHGADFVAAAFCFDDPHAVVIDDLKHSGTEKRRHLIGDSESGILVVVFTLRGRLRIRLISARRADRSERRRYEEGKAIRLLEGPPGHA